MPDALLRIQMERRKETGTRYRALCCVSACLCEPRPPVIKTYVTGKVETGKVGSENSLLLCFSFRVGERTCVGFTIQ